MCAHTLCDVHPSATDLQAALCAIASHLIVKILLTFCRVFSPSEGQGAVFEEIKPLLTSLLDG